MQLKGWVSENRPFWTHRPRSASAWNRLATSYGGSRQIRACLKVARACGCKTVIVENRYVDADYRSEFSAFWSLKFAGRPGFTRRMHFFGDELHDDQVHAIPADADYIGYVVLRPVPTAAVGRTMLRPPPTLLKKKPIIATAIDRVSVFGTNLYVEGVPFCSQDGEYIRCAHAAAWTCHYTAHLRGLVPRRVTSEIASYSPVELSEDRPVPSTGMNLTQLQVVLNKLGQPAHLYDLTAPPIALGIDGDGTQDGVDALSREGGTEAKPVEPPLEPTDAHEDNEAAGAKADSEAATAAAVAAIAAAAVVAMIRRYLNSRLPVIVATNNHTFVLVGYYEETDSEGNSATRFLACDDQIGPFELVADPTADHRGPWEALMIPCPPRAWLEGESVENDAYEQLFTLQYAGSEAIPEEWIALAQRLESGELRLQSMLIRGSEYKNNLPRQGRHADVTRELRLARLSNWVWVVEASDEQARQRGKPSVVAELVYDSTSAAQPKPQRLAFSYPGGSLVIPPDKGEDNRIGGDLKMWKSHLAGWMEPRADLNSSPLAVNLD